MLPMEAGPLMPTVDTTGTDVHEITKHMKQWTQQCLS